MVRTNYLGDGDKVNSDALRQEFVSKIARIQQSDDYVQ